MNELLTYYTITKKVYYQNRSDYVSTQSYLSYEKALETYNANLGRWECLELKKTTISSDDDGNVKILTEIILEE